MQLQFTTITFAFFALAGHVAFANECLQDNLGNGFSSAIHDPSLGDNHYGQSDEETCYPKVHSLGSGVSGNDDGVAMLVGGNFVGLKGAEIEGNMVVMGNFRVEQNGPSNFVSAGEGTQIVPHKGGECIIVGGDMSSAKRLEIFYPHYSCTAIVKGKRKDVNKIAPGWMTNSGFEYKQDSNLDMTKYEQQIDSLRAKSAYWSSLPTTEGASYDVSSRAFNIECTDDDAVQVFNIEASSLQGQGYDSYVFNGNCNDKTVLINVQGTGSVKFTTKHMKWTKDGQVQSGGWANFPSCMNSAILWNFPNAVDVAVEGYDELQGSILITGNLHWKSGSGQSGRTMVLGDLVQDSWGSEFHSFEFNPPKPLPDPNCEEASPPVEIDEGQQDCDSLEEELISDVRQMGVDSKNKLFDTIERLQSRLNGAKQCTDSEWRLNVGHLSYYKIGDGTPTGIGCENLPFTGMTWPYDTNDKGVDHKNYPYATVTEGTCDGWALTCTPESIKEKYSYDRPTNLCPRVYCVKDADPLVSGEYWEDISNFVQDQVPRYIKGKVNYSKYQQCRFPTSEGEMDCNGEIIETSSITSLDFFNSVVTKNTLHLEGGELRYESKFWKDVCRKKYYHRNVAVSNI
jgi:choice-of-anchor A domain-containing protein